LRSGRANGRKGSRRRCRDHDIAQRVGSIGIDDALDFLGDEILCEGACGIARCLLFECRHAASLATSTDDARHFASRGERDQLAAKRRNRRTRNRGIERDLGRIGEDDRLQPDGAPRPADVSVVSVTPTQVVSPLVKLKVNGLLVLKASPRPVTRI
jgi:hypothetical protein